MALRKLGNPPGFQFFRWEFLEPDVTLMTGCVVTRTYARGKRKGLPVYDGEPRNVAVTQAELDAAEAQHEAETGQCCKCLGERQEWAGWNRVSGHSYRTCHRCKGTGARPVD